MFVIIFRPGVTADSPPANINSYGQAPLLWLAVDALTKKGYWVEHFVNAEFFQQYGLALQKLENIEALGTAALEKMFEALVDLANPPPIQGIVAIMPLAFGEPVVEHLVQAA